MHRPPLRAAAATPAARFDSHLDAARQQPRCASFRRRSTPVAPDAQPGKTRRCAGAGGQGRPGRRRRRERELERKRRRQRGAPHADDAAPAKPDRRLPMRTHGAGAGRQRQGRRPIDADTLLGGRSHAGPAGAGDAGLRLGSHRWCRQSDGRIGTQGRDRQGAPAPIRGPAPALLADTLADGADGRHRRHDMPALPAAAAPRCWRTASPAQSVQGRRTRARIRASCRILAASR